MPSNPSGMYRPGKMRLIDNAGGVTNPLRDWKYAPSSTSIKYYYGPFATPGTGELYVFPNEMDKGEWSGREWNNSGYTTGSTQGNSITLAPGENPRWAVATRTRHMGIYYKSGADKGNASSAQTAFRYRVKVTDARAGYYKNIMDITGPHSSSVIELTFPVVTSGEAPPPMKLEASPDGGASGSIGFAIVEVNWNAGTGWGESSLGSYNKSITTKGSWDGAPHTEKEALQSAVVVGSRGKITVEEVPTAKASTLR